MATETTMRLTRPGLRLEAEVGTRRWTTRRPTGAHERLGEVALVVVLARLRTEEARALVVAAMALAAASVARGRRRSGFEEEGRAVVARTGAQRPWGRGGTAE